MLYAFTDESYSPSCYLQTAFLVDESRLLAMRDCETLIRKNLSKIGVAGETEFHGHAIMNARKGWQTLEGKFHSKIAVISSFLKEIERIEGIFIVEAIDLSNFYAFSTTDESPHQYTSRALLERINDFALSSNANVEVYSDKISKEERARIRYPDILGTSQLHKIASVNYVDSEKEFGIQIADICAYICRRYLDHAELNSRTTKLVSELKAQIDARSQPRSNKELWRL